MSRITINEAAIESFFERGALAGAAIPGTNTSVERMANLMLRKARENASGGVVRKRTGSLRDSLEKIIRTDPRTGDIEVGVGSTAEYAKTLEYGSDKHNYPIDAKNYFFSKGSGAARGPWLISARDHPDPLVGRDGKRRAFKSVNHPGIEAKKFLRKAVNEVAFRGF